MADSVFFDGVDDRMSFTLGGAAIDAGPITLAVVLKRNTSGTYDTILAAGTTTNAWDIKFNDAGQGNHFYMGNGADDDFPAGGVVTDTNWRILVATHASAGTPRYHIYDGASWVHANGFGGLADGTAPGGGELLGVGYDLSGGADPGALNILIFGISNTAFSDGACEALSAGKTAWDEGVFIEAIRLDSITVPESLATGGTMALSSTVGVTLDVGDAPTWWDDAEVPPPPVDIAWITA